MKKIIQETKTILNSQKEKFLSNTTGELRRILTIIWNEIITHNSTFITLPISERDCKSDLEQMGFECTIHVKWNEPVLNISWAHLYKD